MRDGEQAPGASMSLAEKLELAKILEEHGRRRHRGRLPDRLQRRLRGRARGLQDRHPIDHRRGLARAATKDIDRCAEAIKPAKRGRIHTFLSTSPQHRDFILQHEPGGDPGADHRAR